MTHVDGGEGAWKITFSNGEIITTDLLVGADGAWSKTRKLLTQHWPEYNGISFVESDLFNADVNHPAEAKTMGEGMLFAFRGETGILGHRETDGSLHA